jgi:hypothetical protein
VSLILFNEQSISRIAVPESKLPNTSFVPTVIVPAITLDTYLAREKIVQVDLIKIDVEGAELFVLEGAHELLSQHPNAAPVILFEYSPSNCANFGYKATAVIDLLMSYGYTVYSVSRTGKISEAGAIDLPAGRHCNLVASKDKRKIACIKGLRMNEGV